MSPVMSIEEQQLLGLVAAARFNSALPMMT